jgi:prepilin-type N-terminal cleavage/methylation domain-containing protein
MNRHPLTSRGTLGFTLIEILIVVTILGVLAAIIIAQFSGAAEEAKKNAFVTNIKIFVESAERFRLDTGEYLEDSSSGVLPAGFGDYVQQIKWESVTPIGGVWDAEYNSFGIISAVGVHFNGQGDTQDDAYMQTVDAIFDDGDLGAGFFRRLGGGRYYAVIAD